MSFTGTLRRNSKKYTDLIISNTRIVKINTLQYSGDGFYTKLTVIKVVIIYIVSYDE